jgi:hypothetical protein
MHDLRCPVGSTRHPSGIGPVAMSANSGWLDQFEERNAAGGHAGSVETIPYPAVPSLMTEPARRFPAPWHADPTLSPLQFERTRTDEIVELSSLPK